MTSHDILSLRDLRLIFLTRASGLRGVGQSQI